MFVKIHWRSSLTGFTAPPSFVPQQPFQYPNIGGGAAGGPAPNIPPFSYNIPSQPQPSPHHSPDDNSNRGDLDQSSAPPPYFPPDVEKVDLSQETPPAPADCKAGGQLDLPDLPQVPSDTPLGGRTPQDGGEDDDIDFDDLTKRFEALKKKKWKLMNGLLWFLNLSIIRITTISYLS